jgi:hypothetical protein
MAPTLIANAINAGSPFSTTSGSVDAASPKLKLDVLLSYFFDLQFTLLVIAVAWTAWLWRLGQGGARQVAPAGHPEPRGKPDILHDPPDIYAILYHSDRHAFPLDPAVCNARSARRTGRRSCGLLSNGQSLIAV